MDFDLFILLTETLGTLAFGISGILLAARYRLDAVGTAAVSLIAAFGGGTLRDILLDKRPFFWMSHSEWLLLFLVLAPLSVHFLGRQRRSKLSKLIQVPDTLGLALFTLIGVQTSLALHINWIVAVLMGVMTASFGGVIAELCCKKIPSVFNNRRPYASISLAGGICFITLIELLINPQLAFLISFILIVALRFFTHYKSWHLPEWRD